MIVINVTLRNAVKTSSTQGKLSQRTMGFAKTPLSPPEQFLKKTTPSANELTNTFKYQVEPQFVHDH